MILITSGEFVQGDLRSEFGEIPPSFLPVGNQPLLRHQIASLQKLFPSEQVTLSVPEAFELSRYDTQMLRELLVEVVFVPEGLDLRESVRYVVTMTGRYAESTRILHGDTLIEDAPLDLDTIAVAATTEDYGWQPAVDSQGAARVWAGYFSFSDTRELVRALTIEDSFASAIARYSEFRHLTESNVNEWLDLGHLTNYYHARKSITTQRSFNQLVVNNGIVRKTGAPRSKILNEAAWFEGLPLVLKPFVPAYYGVDEEAGAYMLEYLPLAPLNELYVHGRHSPEFWTGVFHMFDDWFGAAVNAIENDFAAESVREGRNYLIVDKTHERLAQMEASGFDLDTPMMLNDKQLPSIREVASVCISRASDIPPFAGVLHGDLCFSNTLYDGRNGRLRAIDPRGAAGAEASHVGDVRYDVAKLTHSVVGLYDTIIAGRFELEQHGPGMFDFEVAQEPFVRDTIADYIAFDFRNLPKYSARDSLPETVLLFLTMAPLHSDNSRRQHALLLNGMRLFDIYVGG